MENLVPGEKLRHIELFLNNDFTQYPGQPLADKIVFYFEQKTLVVEPLVDSDEILAKFHDCSEQINFLEQPILPDYIGKTLNVLWTCKNSNGYFDLLILGFDLLRPSLLILSEGSSLKLLITSQILTKQSVE